MSSIYYEMTSMAALSLSPLSEHWGVQGKRLTGVHKEVLLWMAYYSPPFQGLQELSGSVPTGHRYAYGAGSILRVQAHAFAPSSPFTSPSILSLPGPYLAKSLATYHESL